MTAFETITHEVDLCVVGGGLAGMCAAIAAARHGTRVALMHERPMLGGNASSEIRMWICGAHGENNRETGIIEEIMLENQYRNPDKNYSLWDTVLYEKVRMEPNITLLLNCTCMDAEKEGDVIRCVTGWQMTTQHYHRVKAAIFADCSGDSILAPLTGADYRMGREGRAEFGEDIAPDTLDACTMGMSCMIQAREEAEASTFVPPAWAHTYRPEDLPHRQPNLKNPGENFWYLELGGEQDTIANTEEIRDELYRCALGLWDYVKNNPAQAEKNARWKLDWMGMLPGKRESRRYVGDHILTQNDVRSGGQFDDLVAYGGWPMDDHHPGGFATKEVPTLFHPAPSPYGIPYRCLYSRNIGNLMFAGRNISVTHTAMSSTRVMATCALLGQAVGTAAAIAVQERIEPRGVYLCHMHELRQQLMEDDCYLPYAHRTVNTLTQRCVVESGASNADVLRNGLERPIGGEDNGLILPKGSSVTYRFEMPVRIGCIRLVFDSDLNRRTLTSIERQINRNMLHNRPMNLPPAHVPTTLVRGYRVEAELPDGAVSVLMEEGNNYQRLRRHLVDVTVVAVRLVLLHTWGAEECHIFAMDVYEEE